MEEKVVYMTTCLLFFGEKKKKKRGIQIQEAKHLSIPAEQYIYRKIKLKLINNFEYIRVYD